MDARINIIGNLTQDVRNITNKLNRKQSLFNVAVDISENETYFFTCFANYHLSSEELERYKKGALVCINGKYNQFTQKTFNGKSIEIKRILSVIEHTTTIAKGRYVQNIAVSINGYIIEEPVINEGKTTFEVAEVKLDEDREQNKRFLVELPYELSNIEEFTLNSLIYIYGYYKEELNIHPMIGTRVKRKILAKDAEILLKQEKLENKRTLGELLAL